ncbi:adenylate/guanylate cyclase domain-containing protein [Reyranella sp. CPCC 100927]|uniref:adenylate/guanylate cyclase domain-containing protein n=1 Tax=Reyranella sp. CPCC 100927 TaxID=2599616 RepID=UPI0011B3CB45|nr:adenylate/guanylate cyclase domain-containing protein [Reyranella sp. CPCC 100927]TWT15010.1 HAMP domain-containing protein [Reyranella sp. CPCC 100927]
MDGSRIDTSSPTVVVTADTPDTVVDRPAGVVRRQVGRMQVRIVTALAIGFLAVAFIAVAAFAITVLGASDTTQRLLLDRNRRIVEAEAQFLRDRLDPVSTQLQFIASLAARNRLDVSAPSQVVDALAAAMEQLPQVSGAGFAALDQMVSQVVRKPDGLVRDRVPLSDFPNGIEHFHEIQTARGAFWGELLWDSSTRQPIINVRVPIRRSDGGFVGALVATVTMGELSRLIVDHDVDGQSFILVGRDHVLAHRTLKEPKRLALTEDKPLPQLSEVDDPVLAAIWQPPVQSRTFTRVLGHLGHVVDVNDRRWIFVYRQIDGYGPQPWLIGQYFPYEEATRDIERLREGIWAGMAALLLALLLAAVMGLRMARAIRRLGATATALERLDFEASGPMVRSRLKEIDDAAEALEKARTTLKWFGLYVPRRLVARLMKEGGASLVSRRRTATVMFTDIVGFTPMAEDMDERGTAELLNHHFALLGAEIEREHGMIDKFIGDSVMAAWGLTSDHADAACRTALAIADVVRGENAARRARGLKPVRVRIGIHSGAVVIGNIGTPERMNFTVVGDAVNVAQRIEQLGKNHMLEGDEVIALASGDTIAWLQDPTALSATPVFVGEQAIRGRVVPAKIYRLA